MPARAGLFDQTWRALNSEKSPKASSTREFKRRAMVTPSEVEKDAGLELYATSTPPCRAKLRTWDEDFRVEEIMKRVGVSKVRFQGAFPLYKVEKRSIDTLHLERSLSSFFRCRMTYAGIKDKRAVAVQFMSPVSPRTVVPESLEREQYTCQLVGFLRRPLSRAMIAGNRFTITLRECCPTAGEAISGTVEACTAGRVPNYYGLQRFGTRGVRTNRVGRALILAEFEEAVNIMLREERRGDDEGSTSARKLFAEGRYQEGLRLLAPGQDIERIVARSLAAKPGDHIGAIRSIPIALRRFYAQAFQSYIFNRTLSLAMRNGLDISKAESGDNWGEASADGLGLRKVHGVREPFSGAPIPLVQLVGYAYRNYGSRFDACTEEVLRSEGVSARDFYVDEMQEISLEGGFRRAHLTARAASFELEGGGATLHFELPRGEYATVLLREVIKPEDPAAAGFD